MNINRNNYESFFLLYIDNELPVAEKLAVEQFVQVNPDLEEELVMLQQTVLKADEVKFDLKENLFKSVTGEHEIEESLLSHLDNELPVSEQQEVTRLIQDDQAIKKQWELLQSTRLDKNELIPFPDKQLLYRHEGGRVVAFPWLRIAAAAMFIGVATWAGVSFLNNDQPGTQVEPLVKTELPTPASPKKEAGTTDQKIVPQIPAEATANLAQVKPGAAKETSDVTPTLKRTSKVAAQPATDAIAVKAEKPGSNLPKLSSENINNITSNNTITAAVTPQNSDNNIRPGKNETPGDEDMKADVTNSFATSASFNEADNRNDDHVFLLTEDKVKKTKLGGFFRKVKRVIERTANVKEGNHIKVANLEFAIQ